MTDHAALSARLGRAVAERSPGLPLAEGICETLRELLGADGASVTVDNLAVHRVTWCTTDRRSGELENLQDVLGEGPCRDAYNSDLSVSTGTDRWAASRWPQFMLM